MGSGLRPSRIILNGESGTIRSPTKFLAMKAVDWQLLFIFYEAKIPSKAVSSYLLTALVGKSQQIVPLRFVLSLTSNIFNRPCASYTG